MYDYLRRLFSPTTAARVEAAGDRVATAAEQIASEWERAAEQMRERLSPPAELPALAAAELPEPVARRGRSAARNGAH